MASSPYRSSCPYHLGRNPQEKVAVFVFTVRCRKPVLHLAVLPLIAVGVIAVAALLLLWKKSPKLDPDLIAVSIFEN
jgi:hypothetical protein